MSKTSKHPAQAWQQAAENTQISTSARLRLAATAGQMRQDPTLSRRAALIDLLAEGRPIPRKIIWQRITEQLGYDCWGKRPQEQLLRDINVLRQGGIRIGYSRQVTLEGYYLKYPAIKRPQVAFHYQEAPTPDVLLEAIRQTPIEDKLAAAFSMAQFALDQKRLILAQQQPTLSTVEIDKLARQQVFGTKVLVR